MEDQAGVEAAVEKEGAVPGERGRWGGEDVETEGGVVRGEEGGVVGGEGEERGCHVGDSIGEGSRWAGGTKEKE